VRALVIDGTCYTQVTTMTYLSTITAKLQLTLPKRLCAQLGLKRGDKVAVTIEHGGIILTPLRTLIEEAAGSLGIERSTG